VKHPGGDVSIVVSRCMETPKAFWFWIALPNPITEYRISKLIELLTIVQYGKSI